VAWQTARRGAGAALSARRGTGEAASPRHLCTRSRDIHTLHETTNDLAATTALKVSSFLALALSLTSSVSAAYQPPHTTLLKREFFHGNGALRPFERPKLVYCKHGVIPEDRKETEDRVQEMPTGFVSNAASKTRWIVSGLAAATLFWRQDAATILCITGAILNALLSKVLKRVINESRPEGARLADPGMPSSHSQSLFFFATYLSAAAAQAETLTLPALHATVPPAVLPSIVFISSSSLALKAAIAAGLFALASGAAAYRVAVGLHTPAQIGAGAAIGSATGLSWLLYAQPAFMHMLLRYDMGPVAIALAAVGLVTVASIERIFGAALKKRRS